MDVLTQQVIKEPRGFIRVLQFGFALLALYTTSSFSTSTSFSVNCYEKSPVTIKYPVDYPFDFQNQELLINRTCEKDTDSISYKFPMDFSSSPQFFVTLSVLSILYSAGALAGYSFGYNKYRENALLPVLDLIGSSIMSIFWIAGSTAWLTGVSDIKYYVNPSILKEHIAICKEGGDDVCTTVSVGKWSGLNISVIFGFGCILVWIGSIWFVYKETQFFKQQQQQQQLIHQQQFGQGTVPTQGQMPQQNVPPTQGQNPFGNYDPIGNQNANPYIQQPQTQSQFSNY